LSGAIVKDLIVDFPSYTEQQAIGVFFHGLDHLIALHQREQQPFDEPFSPDVPFCTNAWEQRKFGKIVEKYEDPVPTPHDGYERLGIRSHAKGTFHSYVGKGKELETAQMHRVVAGNFIVNITFGWEHAVAITDENDAGKLVSHRFPQFRFLEGCEPEFFKYVIVDENFRHHLWLASPGGAGRNRVLNLNEMLEYKMTFPGKEEQLQIASFFRNLDHLIALHQRKYHAIGGMHMLTNIQSTDLFHCYFSQWIKVYKEGAVRKVTMDKYLMTHKWVERLAHTLRLCDVNRLTYQQLLNEYALSHEKQTTIDFHHQLKGAISDAVDDGLISKDPTRKAIIKGKSPKEKKIKYLNQFELHTLISTLDLHEELNWDWLILLIAKTGMRFSEALALTPKDFDFAHQTLSISKTWDYKEGGGFQPTKNASSVRKIQIDWQTVIQFSELVKGCASDKPIFITKDHVYNSTVNGVLARHCKNANIPVITVHGLRHTHASLLLFAGVSIASVARRLGHFSMTTTQKTYLHIIQELENQDVDLVMRSLSNLS